MVVARKLLYENKVTQAVLTHFWMKSIDLE